MKLSIIIPAYNEEDTIADVARVQRQLGVPVMDAIRVSDTKVFVGFLLGGALPWLFSALSIRAVGRAAGMIVREVREELAIDVTVEGIYDVVYHRYPERTVLVMAYRCRWLSGEVTNVEVSEHCWVYPADVVKFELLPADIPLAKRISEEFANADSACL